MNYQIFDKEIINKEMSEILSHFEEGNAINEVVFPHNGKTLEDPTHHLEGGRYETLSLRATPQYLSTTSSESIDDQILLEDDFFYDNALAPSQTIDSENVDAQFFDHMISTCYADYNYINSSTTFSEFSFLCHFLLRNKLAFSCGIQTSAWLAGLTALPQELQYWIMVLPSVEKFDELDQYDSEEILLSNDEKATLYSELCGKSAPEAQLAIDFSLEHRRKFILSERTQQQCEEDSHKEKKVKPDRGLEFKKRIRPSKEIFTKLAKQTSTINFNDNKAKVEALSVVADSIAFTIVRGRRKRNKKNLILATVKGNRLRNMPPEIVAAKIFRQIREFRNKRRTQMTVPPKRKSSDQIHALRLLNKFSFSQQDYNLLVNKDRMSDRIARAIKSQSIDIQGVLLRWSPLLQRATDFTGVITTPKP